MRTCIYDGLHVLAVCNWVYRHHAGRDHFGEMRSEFLDTFALRRFHREKPAELFGVNIDAVYKFIDPVIRKLHRERPSELFCEPQIAACQQPDIVNAVAHHHQSCQPEAEGEAAPNLRVDTAHFQYVRMHEAAGKQFHPTAVFAHSATGAAADQALNIEFEAGLDERKISWPQPHGDFALEHRAK